MRILIDMNLSPLWCEPLRQQGHEAIHWSAIGDPGATDATLFHWAATNGYIVFTHDLDFGTLLAGTNAQTPSVIQVRAQDNLPSHLTPLVLRILGQFEKELTAGAIIVVDEDRARIRLLPLHP